MWVRRRLRERSRHSLATATRRARRWWRRTAAILTRRLSGTSRASEAAAMAVARQLAAAKERVAAAERNEENSANCPCSQFVARTRDRLRLVPRLSPYCSFCVVARADSTSKFVFSSRRGPCARRAPPFRPARDMDWRDRRARAAQLAQAQNSCAHDLSATRTPPPSLPPPPPPVASMARGD